MSKAFTNEENEDDGMVDLAPLPTGTINYMTRAGAQRMESEIARLTGELAQVAEDLAQQGRIRSLQRRLHFLQSRLALAEVVEPTTKRTDRVAFGATVTVKDLKGEERLWRIVGIDEADLAKGWISWMSPLAAALLEKEVGQALAFRGQHLTIQAVNYIE